MFDTFSRREFLAAAVAVGTGVPLRGPVLAANKEQSKPARNPSEKLSLAVIGVAARGGANLDGVSGENIVMLCDVDAQRLAGAAAKFPKAETCSDLRRVFDRDDLDGVVVSTPDHMHSIPVAEGLRRGWAVYCEKPLTHSLYEARLLQKLTAENKCITQMGNQIHAGSNYRRVVEMIQAGVIGPVHRVHVWLGASDTFHDVASQVPDAESYDRWIGPAPYRPFNRDHYHFNWRYWWDFGGGNLTDFWCHYSDLAFWALDLKHPTTVVATGEPRDEAGLMPPSKLRVEYEYPARGDQPPVHLTWYQGGWKPQGAEVYGKGSAVLFEGTDGRLLADYSTNKVFMQAGKEAVPVEPSIPDSIGHHAEWIHAVKTGGKTTSPFTYGGMLTESAHIGNISYRIGQKKLEWDGEQMRATNCPEADEFVQREYRRGWTL